MMRSLKRSFLLLFAIGFGVLGCRDFIDHLHHHNDKETCEYNGETYFVGESFPSADGCNTCGCQEGGKVACTLMACFEGCYYGGDYYAIGERFAALDNCNSCTCTAPDEVACTEMACFPDECEDGLAYFEPGCAPEPGMPRITAGCYAPCEGVPCATGICQQTDINPCICDPATGMDCCTACGMNEWLCLEPPADCADTVVKPIIASAGKSFGLCMGECDFDIVISDPSAETLISDPSAETLCNPVTLTVRGWTDAGNARQNTGVLTPLGQAKAVGLAAELSGVDLKETYGCPDCADGGASQIALQFNNETIDISYEFMNPPAVLEKADAFTAGLINALDTCSSTEDIRIIDDECTPNPR
jgi:hypothetical protein